MEKPAHLSAPGKRRHSHRLCWPDISLIVVLMIGLTLTSTSSASQHISTQIPLGYRDPSAVCSYGPSTRMHIHMHLSIYVNNERVIIPGGVGIHVGQGRTCYYWLHTHNSSGVVHVEAPGPHTFLLGDFLAIWKKHFVQQGYPGQLNLAGWQVYVNGKPSSDNFFHLPIRERLLVTLTYQSPHIQPDASYNWPGNY